MVVFVAINVQRTCGKRPDHIPKPHEIGHRNGFASGSRRAQLSRRPEVVFHKKLLSPFHPRTGHELERSVPCGSFE